MRHLIALLLLLALTACMPVLQIPAATDTVTPDSYTQCGWMWATRPLPELSDQVQDLLRKEVQPQAQARAEAYGEDCLGRDGEVQYFAAMQTDFYVTLKVNDLSNAQTLGGLLEKTITTLLAIPVEDTPGPQQGYLGLTFTHGNDELRLWFRLKDAQAMIEQGIHGVELLEKLRE